MAQPPDSSGNLEVPAAAERSSLSTRALRGGAWSFGSLAGVRLASLATTSVLAHLLSPHDFGLVALALIVTTALDSIRDLGLNEALIISPAGDLARHAQTAFWFTVLMCVGLALLVAGISPLAADFFHQSDLVAVLSVLGLNLPLRSLGLTHYALAQRSLDFRSRTIAELTEVLVRGIVGVGLALAGLGAWSLVLGYLSGTLSFTIALWITIRWRPRLGAARSDLGVLIRFGGGITALSVIGAATSYIDNIFVGRVLGAAELGIYSLGYRLPDVLISSVSSVSSLVLFPAFATVEGSALRRAMAVSLRYTLLIGLPVAAALIALAHPLVIALFGARWHHAATVMQVLTLGYFGTPISAVTSSAFKASRRVDVAVKIAVPQLLVLVALIAIFVGHGIVAVAACQTAARVLFAPLGVYVATRTLGLRVRDLWTAAWPAFLAAAVMMAAMFAMQQAVTSPWGALLSAGALGAIVYGVMIWIFERDAVLRLWRSVPRRAEPSLKAR